MTHIEILDWGLIPYSMAAEKQLRLVDEVAGGASQKIVFCTHPPTVTLGRAFDPEDLQGWHGPLIESSRGGRATYHGPNQLVIYPILDLRAEQPFPSKDLHAYLRFLENWTACSLRKMGLTGAIPSANLGLAKKEFLAAVMEDSAGIKEPSKTGVWVNGHKIASIGIAVRRWVSYHGIAINVDDDPEAFVGIRPCGFEASVMTNLEKELGRKSDRASVQQSMLREWPRKGGTTQVTWHPN